MNPNTDQASAPRRFWKTAAAGAPEADSAYPVLLDGRPARTPAGAKLAVPTEALARAIAGEWDAQQGPIRFAAMPLSRLAFTAIDRTPQHHGAVAEEIARYAGSDVLCYFAEEPTALVERQEARWGPWLAWAETALGVRLERTRGVVHRPQSTEALERVRALAEDLDDFRLSGLASAASLFGSAILALALERGELDADTAFELARLDEAFQNEQWGQDADASQRTAALKAEAAALGRWFESLRTRV